MRTPTATVRVLVVGPAYCDVVFGGLERLPALGEERFAPRFLVAAGGSAITAIALARLGHRVTLHAELGDDALGAAVDAALAREGVARAGPRGAGAATPVTAALSTPRDRAFVTYLPERTDHAAFARDVVATLDERGFDHLHVAGFPVALAAPDLLDAARARSVRTSFDPGWDERALTDPRTLRFARDADVVLPNALEAALWAAAHGVGADHAAAHDGRPEPAAASRSERAAATVAALASVRPGRVTVVKDGDRGAWGADASGVRHVPPVPVAAIDATGAGDVFDAGFLDAWWAGAPLADALHRGAWCGARATSAYGGATAAPTRAEWEASR